jgi:hypothetical protein
MDPLSFIAKIVGVTARVGAIFAIAAGVVYVGRRSGIEFFVGLDLTLYQSIILAGIIGAGAVAVDLVVAVGKGILWLGSKIAASFSLAAERRREKRSALENMKVLTPEYALALRFLKSQGQRRFAADARNDLLHQMRNAGLIKIDDANWSLYSIQTYYVVPTYIWDAIDVYVEDLHPAHAPWLPPA